MTCPECNGSVSKHALACPHCGIPEEKAQELLEELEEDGRRKSCEDAEFAAEEFARGNAMQEEAEKDFEEELSRMVCEKLCAEEEEESRGRFWAKWF